MIIDLHSVLHRRRTHMFKWLIDKYYEWQFNREFEKRKKEILKKDPFIYEMHDDKKN